jgi:hypothetical protein
MRSPISVFAFALASLLIVPHLPAASASTSVRVENFTGFDDLGNHLAKHLKPELQEAMRRHNLAVFAYSAEFPGRRACYATVGLTEAQPDDRHPRTPNWWFSGSARVDANAEWNASECQAERLRSAISNLNDKPLDELLRNIDSTRAKGGTRKRQAAKKDTAHLITGGDGIADKQSLFDVIHSHNFGKVFDYRHVSTLVYVDGMQFNSGEFMCVAFAGLTARPPEDRSARWPGSSAGFVRLQTGGTLDECRGLVAKQAVEDLLRRPWTPEGLLKGFSLAREDGIPQPDPGKVAHAAKKLQTAVSAPIRATAARTVQVNRLNCTNRCVNGDCVRTFPDGRQERWQAPRVYDPIRKNWKWDTSTNACGV